MKDMKIKHPATYTDTFLPIFYEILKDTANVLDPFAGTGKISLLKDLGYKGKILCNEIEPEFKLYPADNWTYQDAETLDYPDNSIDAICTSPTYGNRMADSHNAKDASKRITYTHRIGRKLRPENTGCMQWGEKYKLKHIAIYSNLVRMIKPGGLFVLNISNHIRKGIEIDVTSWHMNALESAGLKLMEVKSIATPRMKFGANSDKRVAIETIAILTP